jgi:hypothetical protein
MEIVTDRTLFKTSPNLDRQLDSFHDSLCRTLATHVPARP